MASHDTGPASALTLSDIETTADEPRILDLRVAERLGMANPHSIRETIETNRAELERYGGISRRRRENRSRRGRPGYAYYLNEAQTLLLCMLSRTERAADVRQEVIEVFMAWRRGALGRRDRDARIAQLEGREAQCLSIIENLSAREAPALSQLTFFGFTAAELQPGLGVMVLEDSAVLFDATTTDLKNGDRALVAHNWWRGRQAPFVSPICVIPGIDRPADNGVAHLPLGGDCKLPCRILGPVVDIRPLRAQTVAHTPPFSGRAAL